MILLSLSVSLGPIFFSINVVERAPETNPSLVLWIQAMKKSVVRFQSQLFLLSMVYIKHDLTILHIVFFKELLSEGIRATVVSSSSDSRCYFQHLVHDSPQLYGLIGLPQHRI